MDLLEIHGFSINPFEILASDKKPVYLGKDFPGEYAYSEYSKGMNPKLRQVKLQAATDMQDVVLLAKNGDWQAKLKEKHNVAAKNGWYRYDVEFAVPIKKRREYLLSFRAFCNI